MRILLASLTAMALGVGAAVAADLPARMPVKAPVMVPEVYNWTGFYVGGNGGYSWGRSRTDVTFTGPGVAPIAPPPGSVTSNSFNLDGGVAGGQVGYNWRTSNWVLGLEADLQWSGERGSANFTCAAIAGGGPCLPGLTFLPAGVTGTTLGVDQKIEWFGTFRGRAGMLFAPSILGYVTGGLAYGSVRTDLTLGAVNPFGLPSVTTSSINATHAGWTAGAGIEAMFGGNWSGKLEYLYMDLGTVSGSVTSTINLGVPPVTLISASASSRVTDHIFRAGINYHFNAGPVVARY